MKNAVIILVVALSAAAERIFNQHKTIDEIFLTSDGQGFTSENKADDHARYLKDRKVKRFERSVTPEKQAAGQSADDGQEPNDDGASESNESEAEDDAVDREELEAEYAELYGKKPAHNISTEKLKARVEEKRN